MILVIDTNIIFSALIKEGSIRQLLIDPPCMLYAPETIIQEIRKHESYILQKSKLSKEDFETLFELLTEHITIIPKENFLHKIPQANALIGQIDKGDVPFLALALSMFSDGIWTENVKHFTVQTKVKVWTTLELMKFVL